MEVGVGELVVVGLSKLLGLSKPVVLAGELGALSMVLPLELPLLVRPPPESGDKDFLPPPPESGDEDLPPPPPPPSPPLAKASPATKTRALKDMISEIAKA